MHFILQECRRAGMLCCSLGRLLSAPAQRAIVSKSLDVFRWVDNYSVIPIE
ncbi:MAG: hypothetical protein NT163_08400 [Chlorobiales bacterium]|nr:hypothetical protein [Chlorobiales bacterium]